MKIFTGVNPPMDELVHFGVKGMRWGVRKERTTAPATSSKEQRKEARKAYNKFASDAIEKKYPKSEDFFSRKMTQEEYNNLSNESLTLKKGSTVRRVTQRKDEKYGDLTYVSFTDRDKNIYRSVMPLTNSKNPFKMAGAKTYKQQYEITFKALETLKSPSEKERVDAFTALMDTPSVKLKNGKTVTGRDYLKRVYPKEVKTLNTQQLGLRAYKDFAEHQYAQTPINSAYFTEVRNRGYNSFVDDNDRGHLSEAPLVVLNPDGTLKKMNVHPLTADEINQAQLEIKAPGS